VCARAVLARRGFVVKERFFAPKRLFWERFVQWSLGKTAVFVEYFPHVCPEPVLVKKVTTKLPPPFSVCKSVQAYPVLMIVGRSDESSSKASN
jgi:hypothetical protein